MDIILAILGSSVIATIVSFILDRIKLKDTNTLGIKCLLGFEIRRECERLLLIEGNINLEEFRQLEELYATYKQYNGNGFVDGLMDKVRKLPIEGK